jgi:aspartyl-tRNA(Asn)/glutamyl-tRNA(Gln) amidotransferase subunit B
VDTTGELPEAEPRRIAAMLLNAGAKYVNEKGCSLSELTVSPTQVADIVALQDSNKISANAADKLFGIACEPGHESTPAMQLAEQHQLLQISDDSQLETWIDAVLAEPKNEKIVNDIREGKGKAIGALLGQVMKLSKGQANPKAVGDAIQRKLKSR